VSPKDLIELAGSEAAQESRHARKAKKAEQDYRRLQAICDQQAEQIEQLKRAKFSFSKQRPAKPSKTYIRFIIPDTHGSLIDPKAAAAMFADLERMGDKVREVVLLGDHLECGGFLAQHHVLGYVAQSEYTFADDVAAANAFLDQIQRLAPKAKIYYLEGNHENRIERWIVDQVVGHAKDKSYLHRMFSTESVLSLQERGITFLSSGGFYGLRVPGAIKLGKCHFLHGSNHGKDVARKMAAMFGGNVVFAHVHTQQAVTVRTVTAGEIGAWCPGCLCHLQPLYRHSSITDWGLGYAFQVVDSHSDDFLHLNVPVVGDKSLLRGFAGVL
jgi:hypothetical protein